MQLRTLKQLTVHTAEEVLHDKVRIVAEASSNDAPLPRVRVTLGPHTFAGIPARIEDRRNEPWLVLVDRDEVAYLPLRAITTVVVQHVESPVAEPPARLVLEGARKEVQALGWGAELVIEWSAQPGEDERRIVEQTLVALRSLLPSIIADAVGRESAATVRHIRLVPAAGRELAVVRNDATLIVTLGMAADVRDATLRPLIEQQL